MDFPIEVSLVIAVLSSALIWILRLVFVSKGKDVPAWVYTIAVGVIALVIATLFSPVSLPPFPSSDGSLLGILGAILAYAAAVLPLLSSIVGFATLIYNALKDKILDGLGEAIRRALPGSLPGSDIG